MAKFSWTAAMAVYLCLVPNVAGHMEMSMPYPINSQLNSAVPSNLKDYSYTSPLDSSGANFPCKGYQNDRPALITATYTAGQTSKMTFSGSATHGGGSCQISLSYDNGKTFRVIKSMIGGCPLPKEYDFTIPSYAPAGNALLAWTWYNLIGNREIYMDCAQVTIHNASSSPARRRSVQQRRDSSKFTSFEQLPYIWKANLPGTTDCATVEGVNPVFPNPGPDVVYGDGESASSPPTSGSCENPSPPGQAYKDIAVPGGSGPASSGSSSSSSGSSGGSSDSGSGSGSESGSSSGGQVTPIATPSASNPGPSPSSSSSSSSAAVGGGQGSSSVAPVNQQTPVTTITLPSPSTTPSLNGGAGSGSSGSTESSGTGNLAFVSNPPAKSFYPCTPGTFLCTSSTSFLQCASADWYVDMGSVAAGTQCQPQAGPDGARADHIVG